MKKQFKWLMSMILTVSLLAGMFPGFTAYGAESKTYPGGTVVKFPEFPNVTKSSVYSITVNGTEIPVYKAGPSLSFTQFAITGPVEITVALPEGENFTSYSLSPQSAGLAPVRNGNSITFTLYLPQKLILRGVNDYVEDLCIVAEYPEENAPKLTDSNVVNILNYEMGSSGPSVPDEAVLEDFNSLTTAEGMVTDTAAWSLEADAIDSSDKHLRFSLDTTGGFKGIWTESFVSFSNAGDFTSYDSFSFDINNKTGKALRLKPKFVSGDVSNTQSSIPSGTAYTLTTTGAAVTSAVVTTGNQIIVPLDFEGTVTIKAAQGAKLSTLLASNTAADNVNTIGFSYLQNGDYSSLAVGDTFTVDNFKLLKAVTYNEAVLENFNSLTTAEGIVTDTAAWSLEADAADSSDKHLRFSLNTTDGFKGIWTESFVSLSNAGDFTSYDSLSFDIDNKTGKALRLKPKFVSGDVSNTQSSIPSGTAYTLTTTGAAVTSAVVTSGNQIIVPLDFDGTVTIKAAQGAKLSTLLASNTAADNVNTIGFSYLQNGDYSGLVVGDTFTVDNFKLNGVAVSHGKKVDPTGTTYSGDVIQDAIDKLPAGSILYFPAGKYIIGGTKIKNGTQLYLAPGAYLKAATDKKKFIGATGIIYCAPGIESAKIYGRGVIDGSGDVLRDRSTEVDQLILIHAARGTANNLTIEGIVETNSPFYFNLFYGNGHTVRNVKIIGDPEISNRDGVSPIGVKNFLLEDCLIYSADDCTATNPINSGEYNSVFKNSVLYNSKNGRNIFTGYWAANPGPSQIYYENLDLVGVAKYSTDIELCAGANNSYISDVYYRNLRLESVRNGMLLVLTKAANSLYGNSDGSVGKVEFSNIYQNNPGQSGSIMITPSEANSVSNLIFNNYQIAGQVVTNSALGKISTNAFSNITYNVSQPLPEVDIYATDYFAVKGGSPAKFVVERNGGDLSQALDVKLLINGTALKDTDYTSSIASTVTIPAGKASVEFSVAALDGAADNSTLRVSVDHDVNKYITGRKYFSMISMVSAQKSADRIANAVFTTTVSADGSIAASENWYKAPSYHLFGGNGAASANVSFAWGENGLYALLKTQGSSESPTAVAILDGGTTTSPTISGANGVYEMLVDNSSFTSDTTHTISFTASMGGQDFNFDGKISFTQDKVYSAESGGKTASQIVAVPDKPISFATEGTPTIDGTIDQVWESAQSITANKVKRWSTDSGLGDKNSFKMLYDLNNLYVLAEVQDSDQDVTNGQSWDKDSIEIFIDETNSRADSYDSIANRASMLRIDLDGNVYSDLTLPAYQKEINKSSDGYVVEVKIPFKSIRAYSGGVIGFDVQVNDAKQSTHARVGNYGWCDDQDTASGNPNSLGQLSFLKKAWYTEEKVTLRRAIAVKGTPEIDGVKEALWDNTTTISVDKVKAGFADTGASGKINVMWDINNLYVFADIVDTVLDTSAGQLWDKDSMEIFLDGLFQHDGAYQYDDFQVRVDINGQISGKIGEDNFTEAQLAMIQTAVNKTEGVGYKIELKMPFAGFKPVEGAVSGLDIQINEAQGGERVGLYGWNDTTGRSSGSTSMLGQIKFVSTKENDTFSGEPPVEIVDTDNLIKNPGFESGYDNWPDGWGSKAIADDVHNSGLQSVQLNPGGAICQAIEPSAVRNKKVILTIWAKTSSDFADGSNASRVMLLSDKDGSDFDTIGLWFAAKSALSTEWQKYEWEVEVPDNDCSRFRIAPYNGGTAGQLYIDDVSLKIIDNAAVLSASSASFDKSSATDISTEINWNDATAISTVKLDEATVPASGYIVSVNTLTFKKEYLETLANGSYTFTIDFDRGGNKTFQITVSGAKPVPVISTPSATVPEKSLGNTINGSVITVKPLIVNGAATVKVAAGEVESVIAKAAASGEKAVTVKVDAPAATASVTVGLPASVLSAVADSAAKSLIISTPMASVSLDSKALLAIKAQSSEEVKITVALIDKSKLSDSMKLAAGDRPVYDFAIASGSKTISSFNGGTVYVSIPYIPKAGENTNAIVVYYLAENGELTEQNALFDSATGTVKMVLKHFSTYVIANKTKNFLDVPSNAWFKAAVDFTAARGLFTGVSENNFAPEQTITRGMFVTALWKLDGSPKESGKTFSDVKASSYYASAIAWAAANGISNGTGNGKFAPDNEITREQIAVFVQNYINHMGYKLQESETTSFEDMDKASSWAKSAILEMQKYSIMGGVGSNKFAPKNNATRAQAAQIISSLIKVVVK